MKKIFYWMIAGSIYLVVGYYLFFATKQESLVSKSQLRLGGLSTDSIIERRTKLEKVVKDFSEYDTAKNHLNLIPLISLQDDEENDVAHKIDFINVPEENKYSILDSTKRAVESVVSGSGTVAFYKTWKASKNITAKEIEESMAKSVFTSQYSRKTAPRIAHIFKNSFVRKISVVGIGASLYLTFEVFFFDMSFGARVFIAISVGLCFLGLYITLVDKKILG